MRHVMIDLETLGNDYDGIFFSVGACEFDPDTGETGRTFEANVDIASSMAAGRTFTPETIKWWMAQGEAARNKILDPAVPLDQMLSDFRLWLPVDPIVWGNGSNFDIGKLETAYGYGKIPWGFRNVRDVRTVCDLAWGAVSRDSVQPEGIAHVALHDAIWQAKYVSKMWQALRSGAQVWGCKTGRFSGKEENEVN